MTDKGGRKRCVSCMRLITLDNHNLWYNPELGHYCPRFDYYPSRLRRDPWDGLLDITLTHYPERMKSRA